MHEVICESETRRITVACDENSGHDCPLDWEPDDLFVEVLRAPHRSALGRDTVPWHAPNYEIAHYADSSDSRVESLTKHFTRHGWHAELRGWVGYSQGDWLDYVIATPNRERTLYMANNLETWLSGDVYIVTLEESETWTNAAGDTRETWEHVDSVGGVYGDVTPEYALGLFGIEGEELRQ